MMSGVRKALHPGSWTRRNVAFVLLLLYGLLAAFAASPALHEAIHTDAKGADHHCAITALTQGHIDAPICDVSACSISVWHHYAPPFTLSVPGGAVELLPPGRGPPSSFC